MTPEEVQRTRQTFKRCALATMSKDELADAAYVCSGLLMGMGLRAAIEACAGNPGYGEAITKLIRASNQTAVDLEAGVN